MTANLTPDPAPSPPVTSAPAADRAHLCNHAPDATGDLQGCPRWPACLVPDAHLVPNTEPLRLRPATLTDAEVEAFKQRWREQTAAAFGVPLAMVTLRPDPSLRAKTPGRWHGLHRADRRSLLARFLRRPS